MGIYSLPQASRLTRVSTRRIRYWLQRRPHNVSAERIRPLWKGQLSPIDHHRALGFLDLQEIRYVSAFLRAGVTWPRLHVIHSKAKEMLGTQHPFCTREFATDGVTIFDGLDKHLIDMLDDQ